MSERPDWELSYSNIDKLLNYVHGQSIADSFSLHWNSNSLHEAIVATELPNRKKSHENWLYERIQEDCELRAYWDKYYDPKLYHNGLPPYPYEIDVFLKWKYYGGDMAAKDITLLPSDTYKTVVERVLKKFSWMIAYYLQQDWFCRQTRGYKKGGVAKIDRLHRYNEWRERVRNTQSALNNSR